MCHRHLLHRQEHHCFYNIIKVPRHSREARVRLPVGLAYNIKYSLIQLEFKRFVGRVISARRFVFAFRVQSPAGGRRGQAAQGGGQEPESRPAARRPRRSTCTSMLLVGGVEVGIYRYVCFEVGCQGREVEGGRCQGS